MALFLIIYTIVNTSPSGNEDKKFLVYIYIYYRKSFKIINIFISHITYYFVYICTDLLIKHSVNMKTKKEFKYHLKRDVRDDLDFLYVRLSCLLHHDDEGFEHIPSWSILPAFFKVYSHLIWCTKFESWFKKVYK